jgi:hypothetical protein
MKHRHYDYFTDGPDGKLTPRRMNIESDDSFEGPLEIAAFHIRELYRVNEVLDCYNLNGNVENFYEQCRSVLSVPEKHVDEKGNGKLTFQSYFHGIPDSLASINDNAIVVVAMHPKENGEYNLVCYIHANLFTFMDMQGTEQEGFYYNVLRISEKSEHGQKIYRRKRIFTLIFSVLHSLVEVRELHFAYAAMGKENQAINEALVMNSIRYKKHFEKFYVRNNTKINKLFGSASCAKKMTDITENKELLSQYFKLLKAQKGRYLFMNIWSEEQFFGLIDRIKSYSKSSKIYAILGNQGEVLAGIIALNWGDYFHLKLENPKGIFKFLDSLNLTKNLLYPILMAGPADLMKILMKGIAWKFNKEHSVKLSLYNSYAGDPYEKIKESIIFDNYQFFIITDVPEKFKALQEFSKDSEHIKVFIEHPIL